MKNIIIAMIQFAFTQSDCTSGCLSCSDNNDCEVCDVTSGYYLEDNSCQRSSVSNCQIFDLSGHCFVCEQGYYTDPNAQQCISAVDSGELDANCQRFNLERQCVQCRENHYLLGSSCFEVPQDERIQNCLMYNTKSECVECLSGTTLNFLGTQCLTESDIDNCTEQTAVKCNHCKEGYSKNPNFYLLDIQTQIRNRNFSYVYPKLANFVDNTHFFEEGCLKNIGENCLVYQDFNQCLLCESEHYLKSGKCYAFPKEQIENCRVYQNENKCLECQQGYYLTTNNNCKKIDNDFFVTNCVLYNPKARQIECMQCKNNYFVNTSKGCSPRTRDINLCKDLSDNSDTCEQCKEGYRVTDDGIKCLPVIDRCMTYVSSPSSANLERFTCQRCNRGHYFNTVTNTCEVGNILNCEFYQTNPDNCQVCENKFYLESGECFEHESIQNCGVYSQITANQCEECDNTSIKMNQITTCDAVEIEGCRIYESTQTCLECEDGYDLSNKLCTLLDIDSHCKRSVDGVCNLCIDQYFLRSDNLCYLPFEYERKNCINNINDGTSGNFFRTGCKVCQDFHIPFNLKNHNVCLTVDEFALIDTNYEVANCQRYQEKNNSIVCKQCEVTYVLNEGNNTCSKDCPAGQFKLNFHFADDGLYGHQYKDNFYCVVHENVKTKSVTLNQDYAVTSWKLNNTYSYKMNFTKIEDTKLVLPSNVDGIAVSDEIYTYPDYTENDTFQPSTDVMDSIDSFFLNTTGEAVENCEFYFEFRSVNYCSKCNFGFFGQIDFYKIENCHKYNNTGEQCEECVYQHQISNDFHNCTYVEIEGCELYELNTASCLACEDGMFLNVTANECVQNNIVDVGETSSPYRTIDNCKIHHPYQDGKCLLCDEYYLLNSLHTKCGKILDNCRETVYKADNSTLECEKCDMGYYSPTANKTSCVKGTEDPLYCWEYENVSGDCIAYRNVFLTHKMNECVKPFPLDNCVEYDTSTPPVCTRCDEEDYYMVGGTNQTSGICCKYFTYPGASQDPTQECTGTDTENKNCKIYEKNADGDYVCKECQEGYLMNPIAVDTTNTTDTYPQQLCCPYGTQQGPSLSIQCESFVTAQPPNTTDDSLTCDVYDLDTEKCKLCKDGEYFHKDKCCSIGTYHNGTDADIDCDEVSITASENCTKYDENNTCIECATNYTLKHDICCDLSTDYYKQIGASNWTCAVTADDIVNCTSIKSTFVSGSTVNTCEQCASGFHKVNDDKNCCVTAADGTSEVWNSDLSTPACADINSISGSTVIASCTIYEFTNTSTAIKNSLLCDTCSSGFPSTQERVCCGAGELFDFDYSLTNVTDCRTDDFIYENCAHIIPFDQANNFCEECKEGYYKINNRCSPIGKYMKLRRENTAPTWADTNITDDLVSSSGLSNSTLCEKVHYVLGEDDGDASAILRCSKCVDGYELRPDYLSAANSSQTAELPCEDEKLQNGYYLDALSANTTRHIDYYTRDCLLYNADTDLCQETAINSVFEFGYCATYENYLTYKTERNQTCCQGGKFYNDTSYACETNTISDCLIQNNDGSTCYECKEGYYKVDATTCTAITTIDKCVQYLNETLCERCELGYYLVDGTQDNCTADPGDDRFLKYCAKGTANTSCAACHPGYFLSEDYCCQFGYHQKASGEECVSNSVPNCAMYSHTNANCTECFTFEDQFCFNQHDWLFKPSSAANSPYIIEQNDSDYDYQNREYYNSFRDFYMYDGGCCKFGYYWNTTNSACEKIELANCLRLVGDTSTCLECEPNYKVKAADDTCEAATSSDAGFYSSNNEVCPETTYYNSDLKRCVNIVDKNCNQTDDNINCLECNTGFTQSAFYQQLIVTHFAGERDGCIEQLPTKIFKPCVQSDANNFPQATGSTNLTDVDMFIHDKIFYRRQNCKSFDFTEEVCQTDKCFDGYYLVEGRCCKKDEYPFNDGCINKKTMLDLCNYYDETNYVCKGCNPGYVLTNDYCCLEGQEYDKINGVCQDKPMHCKTFFAEQNLCTECDEGSHMDAHNHCCPNYQYFDEDTKKCENFKGYGMAGCLEGEKEHCYKCSDQSLTASYDSSVSAKFKKSNGKCCHEGYAYDTTLKICKASSSSCKTFDNRENCVECADGFYKSQSECCPLGTALDSNGDCITDDSTIHCTQWTWGSANNHTCSECDTGFYLSQDHCCPFTMTWHSTDEECVPIYQIDNLHLNYSVYGSLSLTRNCRILETDKRNRTGDLYYACEYCDEGYYLSQTVRASLLDNLDNQNVRKCCADNMYTNYLNVDGCRNIDKENMADYPGDGQLFFPSNETECIQADFFGSQDTNGDYKSQIVCIKCLGDKVVELLDSSYTSFLTAYNTNSSTVPDTFVQCVDRNSTKHEDNCWAHYVEDDSDRNTTRYCRNFDRSQYYLTWKIEGSTTGTSTSQLKPCQFGQYYKVSTGSCTSIDDLSTKFSGCKRARTFNSGSSYSCEECYPGHYLVSSPDTNQPYCIAEDSSDSSSCLITQTYDNTTTVCLACFAGYGLDSSGDCQSITSNKPQYCSSSSDSAITCNYCTNMTVNSEEYQTYLSNDRCCLEGEVYDETLDFCVAYDDCLAAANENKTLTECQFCNWEKDLYVVGDGSSDGQCCKKGTVPNSSHNMCEQPTDDNINQCKFFINTTHCREATDLEKEYLTEEEYHPCFNSTYYYHSGSCCAPGHYYDSGSACTEATGDGANCKQFQDGSTSACSVCADGAYMSDNSTCCQEGNYFDGSSCDTIDQTNIPEVDTDCIQYKNETCLKCNTTELNVEGCCGTNFKNSTGFCVSPTTIGNCTEYSRNDCIRCKVGFYLTNGICCEYGEYESSGSCTDTSVISDCLIPDPSDATKCKTCDLNKRFSIDACCDVGTLQVTSGGDCIDENIVLNCLTYSSGNCTACVEDSDLYLTNNMCCSLGQRYNSISKACEDMNEYCLKGTDASTNCTTCRDGYYVNPLDNEVCCMEQVKPGPACRSVSLVPQNANCAKFDSDGDCTECQSGYNLYNDVCCASPKVLLENGSSQDHCVEIDFLTDNCDQFDALTLKCKTCSTDYNNDTNDQKVCCKDGQHFDMLKVACVDNHAGCEQQKYDQCTECFTGFYLTGKNMKRCCQDTQYFNDDEMKCVDIEIENCNQMTYNGTDYICSECKSFASDSDFDTVLTNGHCCFENEFWDPDALQCSNPIKYCNEYEKNSTTAQCLSCEGTMQVLKDQTKCCERQKFYFSTRDDECYDEAPLELFSWHCAIYDPFLFKCVSCREGYYLMNDHCCKEGTYHLTANFTTDFQTCTGTFNVTNCAQGSDANTCTECKLGYQLFNSTTCVEEYDNCYDFNVTAGNCNVCEKDYYLSESKHCCSAGKKRSASDSSCVNITTIDNCVQLDPDTPTECKICEKGYYLTGSNDVCCQNRHYCPNNTTSTLGEVENCERYVNSTQVCTLCETDHSLMKIDNSTTTYCYPTPFENCHYSEFIANESGQDINRFNCTTCPHNHLLKNLTSSEDKYIRHYLIEHCWVTDTRELFEDGNLKCKYCDYDYYLDDNDYSCKARTSTYTDNCVIRDLFDDKCDRCEKGYYLSSAGACNKQSDCDLEVENSSGSTTCAKCISTKRLIPDNTLTGTKIADLTTPLAYGCQLKTSVQNDMIDAHKPEADPPGYFPGMIKKCERHYQCKEDYVNGLEINLHKYLSCHVCIEPDRIPFVSLDLDKNGNNIEEKGIKRFSYKNNSTKALHDYNKNRFGKSSQCFKADLSDFNATTPQNFPSNCAVGILNSGFVLNAALANSSSITDPNQLGVFCAACKPGYKPLFSNVDYHVYQCQAIANCVMTGAKASKSSFNECDHCAATYYHPYTTANGLDKTQCIQSSTHHDPNCYAFDVDTNQCKVCLDGYSKNYDRKCEKLEIPYCNSAQSNFKTHLLERDYRLAFYRGVEGCKVCNEGFLPLYGDSYDDFTCIYSPYARSNVFVLSDQKYTPNCRRYYQDGGVLICDKCLQNYIMTDQKQCISINNNHKDCLIAKDANMCFQCNSQTVLVLGKCLQKTIENCLTYEQEAEELLCETCVNGFYLNEQICYGGEIQNCSRYASENVCTACYDGYQLVQNRLNQYFCIKIISDTNCQDWSENQFSSMNIRCETCKPKFFLNTINVATVEVCLPLYTIDGCLQYNVNSLYSNSTLMCDKCQINMFLQNGKCYTRQVRISGCIEYDPAKDACAVCRDGFYLSDDQMSCILNPSGTVSCAIYDESETCILCKPSYYLMNSKCFDLPVQDSIKNCQAYNELKQCMKCQDGYLLEQNECKLKDLLNCLVYETSTSCQVCQEGFGVEIKDGLKSCVAIQIVPHCGKYDVNNSPFPCVQCIKDYYLNPNDNQCIAVEGDKLIPNCVTYNLNQSCQACDSQYVLTVDSQRCVFLNHPSNCDTHVEVPTPFCIKCELGFVVNQEYQCVEGPQKQFENCLITELDNRNVCALCSPGYYMKSDKNCYKVEDDAQGDNGTNGDTNNGGDSNNNNNPDNGGNDGNGDNQDSGVINCQSFWGYIVAMLMMLF